MGSDGGGRRSRGTGNTIRNRPNHPGDNIPDNGRGDINW